MGRAIPPRLILILSLLAVVGITLAAEWRNRLYHQFINENAQQIQELNERILEAYQNGFFYYYNEKFIPQVTEAFQNFQQDGQPITEFYILEHEKNLSKALDSANKPEANLPSKVSDKYKIRFSFQDTIQNATPTLTPQNQLPILNNPILSEKLDSINQTHDLVAPDLVAPDLVDSDTLKHKGTLYHLYRSNQTWFIYQQALPSFTTRVLPWLALYLFTLIIFGIGVSTEKGKQLIAHTSNSTLRFFRKLFILRTQIALSIGAVHILTGLFIYVTLSRLQTKEETSRIERSAIQFSQITTDKIISDYSNFFYFSFKDRFLPGIKNLISSNENLLSITLISTKSKAVLFNSAVPNSGPIAGQPREQAREQDASETDRNINLPIEVLSDLAVSPLSIIKEVKQNQNNLFSENISTPDRMTVYTKFTGDTEDSSFIIRYEYQYASLERALAKIRNQLIRDLFTALIFGFIVALLLAQFISNPIKRLSKALSRVTTGDYKIQIPTRRFDEIGQLTRAFNLMTEELRKREELRKFISRSSYQQIMNNSLESKESAIGGRRVHAAILFCDIRNFVSHCETLEAEQITAFLNLYFSEMVNVVSRNGGEVDKFIGDALLAVFYSDTESNGQNTAAIAAIQCSMEMKDALISFNQRRKNLGEKPIEIGVGISFGEVISGPIGSPDRMDFTVIGDVVNLANRIEKLSKRGKYTRIVFTGEVKALVEGLVLCDPLPAEPIRGKEEPISVYELISLNDLDQLIKLSQSNDKAEVLRAVQVMGFSGQKQALYHLIPLLKSKDEEVRLHTVLSIAKLAPRNHHSVLPTDHQNNLANDQIGDHLDGSENDQNETVDTFFNHLKTEDSERVKSAIIKSLGQICTTDRLLDLGQYLNHDDVRLVANTIEALGQLKSRKALDLIAPKLDSTYHRIKANAAIAFFQGGRFEVVGIIKPLLLHSEPLMRASACFALGELARSTFTPEFAIGPESESFRLFLSELQSCVPILVALLKDPDRRVVKQSISALGKLQDRSALLSLIDLVPSYMALYRDQEKAQAKVQVNAQKQGQNQKPDGVNEIQEILKELSFAIRSMGAHRVIRDLFTQAQMQ